MNSQHKKRLVFLALFVFTLFSLLIFQFYKIQIVEGDKWTEVARRQHFFVVTEPFRRGRFFANTSIKRKHPESPQQFVLDIQKYHLHIDPDSIPKSFRDEVSDTLMNKLDLTADEETKFRKQFNIKSRNRKLAMWLDRESRDSILAWWRPYARKHKIASNAVFFVSDYQRSYPFGKLLGQVLHTVQSTKDEVTKQAHPTGGMELYFNSYLKGKLGQRLLKRSPRNAFETGTVIQSPENGADIYLTINHVIQAIAEEELEKGVKHCGAKGGWAVMMDPKTGEILALAQYPFFHPAKYSEFFNDPQKVDRTSVHAVTDAYEPGSIMKPFTLAIALKANGELERPLFYPGEKIDVSDGRFPGRKDLNDLTKHNYLNMYMALQKSSNIYFARRIQHVIDRLGANWYRNQLQETFGFGKQTNIELPSETRGLLPTPGKVHPNGHLEWSTPTPSSLAIGHNIQVNSIQMVRAFSVLANGGYLVNPTLVRKIVKDDEVILDKTGAKSFPRVLDREIANELVKAMKYVTKFGGSGRRAEVWGYSEAGKTGTANKIINGKYSNKNHVASFIGMVPASDPAFVLLITMNEPEVKYIPGHGHNHHGSIAAAPVFREIARRSLAYLGIDPDDPHGYPRNDPRFEPDKADWVQENRRLLALYEEWNK